jgi:class 3 adenylate cyclase/tetratricopeptide (TPR) repeat protein/DNA-binding XRE family transcriptional regulator
VDRGAPELLGPGALFGTLLREHRLAAGLTQATLAERAGLSTRAVQHLECSLGQPRRETARLLADALLLTDSQRSQFELAGAPAPRRRAAPTYSRGDPRAPNDPGHAVAPRLADEVTAAESTSAIRAAADPHPGDEPAAAYARWGGERKQVTALFADIACATELLAKRDPEEARARLDPLVERMVEAVHHYDGTITQVTADGIAALFGAPRAHEDHAARACHGALRMREAVRQRAAESARLGEPLPAIRVGLASGAVVVRSLGTAPDAHYTAAGPAVQWARGLKEAARGDRILVSPTTRQLIEGYVQLQALGSLPLPGMGLAAPVHEVVRVGPSQPRLRFAATRGVTRFIGRQAELDRLAELLGLARAGRGQVVAVLGEAGVGKTRLLWELTRAIQREDWLVLETAALSYGQSTPYLPLVGLLRRYCGIGPGDDLQQVRQKLERKVLALDPLLQPTLSALLALLDGPVDESAWQALDPLQRRQRTLDGLKRLVLRESQSRPVLLLFEDLHWLDAASQAFLDTIVDGLPLARVVLVVSYRPGYQHGWGSRTSYTQLRLDRLPAASAEALLEALVGGDESLQRLKQLIVHQTQGNPFFLEESVQTLVETQVLCGSPGAYRLAKRLERLPVPDTVQATLAARIDRLALDDRRLLQSAAVIGNDVPYSVLQAIAELSEEALRPGLGRLQAAELLYEAALLPDPEYTFKHALTHEVAYGSLLQEQRRTLHARIVEAIETIYPDRLAEHVERLAYHAVQGEQWPAAVRYLHQAGRRALAHWNHRQAVSYLEQALEALGRLPETRETREQALDLRLDLRDGLLPLGERQQLLRYQREAETLAEALGDPRRLGRVLADLVVEYRVIGEHDRSIDAGQRALVLAEAMADAALAAVSNLRLAQTYEFAGDYRRAIEYCHQTLAVCRDDPLLVGFGLVYPSVGANGGLGTYLAALGEFAEGTRRVNDALRLAERLDHPGSVFRACGFAGELHLRQGNLDQALPLLQRGLLVCQSTQVVSFRSWITSALGYAYALLGRLDEAVALLEQAVEHGRSIGPHTIHSLDRARLSDAYLLVGRREDARAYATEALALARQCKGRSGEAAALRVLGEIAATADSPDAQQAEAQYRQALALAEELSMRPLAADCHLGLGGLYAKLGRHGPAGTELTTARAMYRSMDMLFWLERAEIELARRRQFVRFPR